MTIQDQITTQARTTVKQIQEFLENLPKPVEVVEKAFGYSELALATVKNAAIEATKALTPGSAKPAKKASAKKVPVAASAAAE